MLSGRSLGLQEAVRELREMSLTKRMRLLREARLKEIRDRNARDSYVRRTGLEQGLEQGRVEMLAEFLQNGGTRDQARRFWKVTEEQLQEAEEYMGESAAKGVED